MLRLLSQFKNKVSVLLIRFPSSLCKCKVERPGFEQWYCGLNCVLSNSLYIETLTSHIVFPGAETFVKCFSLGEDLKVMSSYVWTTQKGMQHNICFYFFFLRHNFALRLKLASNSRLFCLTLLQPETYLENGLQNSIKCLEPVLFPRSFCF